MLNVETQIENSIAEDNGVSEVSVVSPGAPSIMGTTEDSRSPLAVGAPAKVETKRGKKRSRQNVDDKGDKEATRHIVRLTPLPQPDIHGNVVAIFVSEDDKITPEKTKDGKKTPKNTQDAANTNGKKKQKPEKVPFVTPVALWGQYTVEWDDKLLKDIVCLSVSTQESWVREMVGALTTRCIRDMVQTLMTKVMAEFKAALVASRSRLEEAEKEIEDAFTDAARKNLRSENSNAEMNKLSRTNAFSLAQHRRSKNSVAAFLNVNIGDHIVEVLNDAHRFVIKLFDHGKLQKNTIAWIQKWLLPLAKVRITHDSRSQKSESSQETQPVLNLAPFHFKASPTPNIRDRVTWNPTHSAWLVHVKKDKHPAAPKVLKVETTGMSKDEAAAENDKVYIQAIQQWNKCDGSNRQMLEVPKTPILFYKALRGN